MASPAPPRSAYIIFCDEKRPALVDEEKKEHGEINIAAVQMKLGTMWKSLSDEDKAQYQRRAVAESARVLLPNQEEKVVIGMTPDQS
jgi:hypothetical protein